MRRPVRSFVIALGLLGLAGGAAAPARGASDPRFFGTFCGTHRESQTVTFPCFPLLPWILCDRTESLEVDFRIEAEHHLAAGQGIVLASGRGEVVGEVPGFMGDYVRTGDQVPFVIAGRVTARGRLEGTARLLDSDPVEGSATLAADGLEIEVRGLDRTLTLRKDRCGNGPPTAAIVRPAEGERFPWHEIVQLSGSAADAEDASFPDERRVWTSSLDGALGTGSLVWKDDLSPGTHRITFTVTDSGGLTASATREVTIENHLPQATIDRPVEGGLFYEGVGIVLRGRGFDRETGNLTGGALVWTAGGGELGTGNEAMAELPAGLHTIRLTASDGELSGEDEVTIRVRERPGGNAPPAVVITAPPDRSAPVGDRPDECLTLTAHAEDAEDGPLTGAALVWSDAMEGEAMPRVLTPRGASVEVCGWSSSGGDTWHTVTVTATDSGGATATDQIRILVIGGGLI